MNNSKATLETAGKQSESPVQASMEPDAGTELSGAQLDNVSGGLAPNSMSMLKALWRSKGPAQLEEGGRPMSSQAYASHGAATKG